MIDHLLAPRLVSPGEATVYDQLQGEKIHLILSGAETDGAFTLFIDEVPPHGGPPLHIHHHEDETFYILEGELVVQVNEERFTVPAGCTAFLPRGIPHTFTNLGTKAARALVVLTPGGLEGFFAEVEPLVTQAEPDMTAILTIAAKYGIEAVGPPLAGQMNGTPIAATSSRVVRPETAPTYHFPTGEAIHLLLTGEQTNGQFALLYGSFPSGTGAELHRHQHEDELFYVLDGVLTTQAGSETVKVVAGAAAYRPRKIAHDFHNHSPETVKALGIVAPAGFETYFTEVYGLMTSGELNEETMVALAEKYGLEPVATT